MILAPKLLSRIGRKGDLAGVGVGAGCRGRGCVRGIHRVALFVHPVSISAHSEGAPGCASQTWASTPGC